MAAPPAPDPLSGLALKVAGTALSQAPKGVKWTVEQVEAQTEMARLLRTGIARAICPEEPKQESVRAAADMIFARLGDVDFPNPRQPGPLKRWGQGFLKKATLGRYRPPTTDLSVVGADYFDLLALWLQAALDHPRSEAVREQLAGVRCGGIAPETEVVLERFPGEMTELVYTECASSFCDGLKEILRERKKRRARDEQVIRDERLKRWLLSLGAGAGSYVVLDATWLSTPSSALIGALAALGVAEVQELRRQKRLSGLRTEVVRTIAEILQAAKPADGDSSWRPPPAELRGDLKDLIADPRAAEDQALVNVVSDLAYALRYWERNPEDVRAREFVGHALDDALALLTS